MTQLTLVLPFALPPPEYAPDLVRALKAPALAALLSRTSAERSVASDDGARALPHELWLARTLGLASDGQPGFAASTMRGYGLDPVDGTWFIVNPSHIEIARSHLLMSDLRQLGLCEADARALFDSALPYFEEAGHALVYGDAQTWFMRADDWSELDTATPDTAVGMNLTDWMPSGPRAIAYRKLQNEVQMLWYTHPVNARREARGEAAINAFWPWSGARGGQAEVPAGGAALAAFEAPPWLAALAGRRVKSLGEIDACLDQDTLLVCGNLSAAAIAAEWSDWLAQMERLDQELFAPLLAALGQRRLSRLDLVLSHRSAQAEFTTTAMAQHKFWRRTTLDRLL